MPHRDRIVALKAPFTGRADRRRARREFRFGGVSWTDKGTILLTENDRAHAHDADLGAQRPTGASRGSCGTASSRTATAIPASRCSGPGRTPSSRTATRSILNGQGASPEGDRPFLDRLNLKTLGERTALPQRRHELRDRSSALLDDDGTTVSDALRDEDASRRTTSFASCRQRREAGGDSFKDPHPQITPALANRLFVTYKRKDGVGLSGTLYLPLGYQKGQRVPMVVWAYPREFVDADAASQVVGSPNRFTTVGGSSHLLLLTQGYAIFDGPTMPIVGPGETANDTYVEQLVVERRGGGRQGGRARASPIARASASAATATARS